MTPLQALVLDVLRDRARRGKSLTIMGAANETGIKATMVRRIFQSLKDERYIEVIDGPNHQIVHEKRAAQTYRRVADDGVEVTQCPPAFARGYGFDQGWKE